MTFWSTIGEFFYGLSLEYLTIPRLLCFGALIVGYFFGMLQPAWLVSKAKHADLHPDQSGRPESANRYRVLGSGWSLLIFLIDIAKVAAAIFLVKYIFITWLQLPADPVALKLYTGLGVVLGHDFPIYLRGGGGKGVAVTCAVYACLGEWKYLIVGLVVFLVIFLITKYVSLSSMVLIVVSMFAFLFFTLMNWTYVEHEWLIDCHVIVICFSVLVLVTHRRNIIRLLYAEEPRFRFRRIRDEEFSDGAAYDEEEEFAPEASAAETEEQAEEVVVAAAGQEGRKEEEAADSSGQEGQPEEAEQATEAAGKAEKKAEAAKKAVTADGQKAWMKESAAEAEGQTEEVVAVAATGQEGRREEEAAGPSGQEGQPEKAEQATEAAGEAEKEAEAVSAPETEHGETTEYRTSHKKTAPVKKKKKHSTTKKKKSNSTKKKRK